MQLAEQRAAAALHSALPGDWVRPGQLSSAAVPHPPHIPMRASWACSMDLGVQRALLSSPAGDGTRGLLWVRQGSATWSCTEDKASPPHSWFKGNVSARAKQAYNGNETNARDSSGWGHTQWESTCAELGFHPWHLTQENLSCIMVYSLYLAFKKTLDEQVFKSSSYLTRYTREGTRKVKCQVSGVTEGSGNIP